MTTASPSTGTPYNSLTQSPTNLKEAIDWILRVTNKDGLGDGSSNGNDPNKHCLCPLSQAVVTVLRDVQVKEYIGSRNRNSTVNRDLDSSDEEWNLVQNILASIETIGGVRTTRELIQDVASKLADLIGWEGGKIKDKNDNGIGCPGNGSGGSQCGHGAGCSGYKSSYSGKKATISAITGGSTGAITGGSTGAITSGSDSGKDSWTILAKIFLGCIPFIFSGLSFMYWYSIRQGIKDDNRVQSKTQLLGQYMFRMGYHKDGWLKEGTQNNSIKTTEGIYGHELHDLMKNCGILGETKASSDMSFAGYLEKVRKKVK